MHRTWRLIRMDTGAHIGDVKHVTSIARLKKIAQKVANTMGVKVGVRPANFKRPNPAGVVVGSTWTKKGGGRSRVQAVDATRVKVLDLDTGASDWMDRLQFLATHNRPTGPRRNPPRRRARYGSQPRSTGRAERLTVHADYWIESSTPEEMAADPQSPYRMVTTGGQRFALSALDAIRAQKQGLEFRTRRNPRGGRRRELSPFSPGRGGRNAPFLSVFDQHRLKIARDTLRMNDAMARIMGGMTKDEARAVILELTGKPARENPKREKTGGKIARLTAEVEVFAGRPLTSAERRIVAESVHSGLDAQMIAEGILEGNPSRSRRARYYRSSRRRAPRGVPGLGSRRATRAIRSGQLAKAHHYMMSTADRGRFRVPNPTLHVEKRGKQWAVVASDGTRTETMVGHDGVTPAVFSKQRDAESFAKFMRGVMHWNATHPRENPTPRPGTKAEKKFLETLDADLAELYGGPATGPEIDFAIFKRREMMQQGFTSQGSLPTIAAAIGGQRGYRLVPASQFKKRNPRRKSYGRGQVALFERFQFTLPTDALVDLTGAGDKSEAASYWATRVVRPESVTPEALRAELKEYGAWDAEELADDDENWKRIIWIAAGNIVEGNPRGKRRKSRKRNPRGGPRIVYNKLLGGWYVVTGPHQTPLNGRFNSKAEAQAWLSGRRNPGGPRKGKVGTYVSAGDMVRVKSGAGRGSRGVVLHGGVVALVDIGGDHRWINADRLALVPNRMRHNPGRAPSPFVRQRAEKMFRTWHDFSSSGTKRVRVPSRTIPKMVVGLGKVVRIDYISDKWEGKPVTYTHSTKRPHPELVTDPDGRQLYLVGGRMRPTADGLVN